MMATVGLDASAILANQYVRCAGEPMRKRFQWRIWCILLSVVCVSVAQAQSSSVESKADAPGLRASSLIGAWVEFPQLDNVSWPYSYIRVAESDTRARAFRSDLDKELSTLTARLEAYGGRLGGVETTRAWRDRLARLQGTRVPGDWSPAALMTHPYQRPEARKIVALGACESPDWVEVWDQNGVRRVDWEPGMQISDLLARKALRGGVAGRVAIVDPYGLVTHTGIQAWNFADASLSPGTKVVATLALRGDAFPWIRDAIARVLAHALPADDCREVTMQAMSDSDE